MSSSIDYFDCPRCGGNAYKEQDNLTCEITHGCSDCSWKGEPLKIDISKEVSQVMDMEQPKESDFEQWYEKNKHNENLLYDFKDVVMKNPDYPLCFKEWCKLYFKEHVDV